VDDDSGVPDAIDLDHVTFVAADGDAFGERLRSEHGLGWFAGGYLDHLGARSHNVPLRPPHYLEWLTVEDRDVAEQSDTGRTVLEAHDRGGGYVAWTVVARDLDAVAARLGITPYEGATRMEDTGLLRRWRTVAGPLRLPIFIEYEDPDARRERQRGAYEGIGHTCAPRGIARVEVGGDERELADWLGPHDLPVALVDGPPGVRAVYVDTAAGVVRI
jgi:hypothetical protein